MAITFASRKEGHVTDVYAFSGSEDPPISHASQTTAHNGCTRLMACTTDSKRKSAFMQYLSQEQQTLRLKYPFLTTWQIKNRAIKNWGKVCDKEKNFRFV